MLERKVALVCKTGMACRKGLCAGQRVERRGGGRQADALHPACPQGSTLTHQHNTPMDAIGLPLHQLIQPRKRTVRSKHLVARRGRQRATIKEHQLQPFQRGVALELADLLRHKPRERLGRVKRHDPIANIQALDGAVSIARNEDRCAGGEALCLIFITPKFTLH